jgi:hypothetical protein
MKSGKMFGKSLIPSKKVVIRTTFLDLVSRLADLAKDDAALIASVRRILEAVTFARSIPWRLCA